MLFDPNSVHMLNEMRVADAARHRISRQPRKPRTPRTHSRHLNISLGLWHIACWIDHGRTVDHPQHYQVS